MARDFVKTSTNRLEVGANKVGPLLSGASAVSFHCIAKADSLDTAALDNVLFAVCIDGTGAGIYACASASGAEKFTFGGRSQGADSFQQISGTTTIATATEYCFGGVLDIAGDLIRAYVNGTEEASGAKTFGATSWTQGTPSTPIDRIGCNHNNTATNFQWDGPIAEVALWVGDIGAAGFAQLADRRSALRVQPDLLIAYWPLIGVNSPEPELVSAKNATIVGSLSAIGHPRIIRRHPRISRPNAAAAAAGGSVGHRIIGGGWGGRMIGA